MIINLERAPEFSLYYIGSIVLEIFRKHENEKLDFNELYTLTKQNSSKECPIDFFCYALDWLYMLSLLTVKEGKFAYAIREASSTEDKPIGRDNKGNKF